MASIEKRETNGKRFWLARYRDPQGKQRSKSFTRKVDAERFLTGIENAKIVGTYIDPTRARITVHEWAGRWLAGRGDLAPKTLERYQGILDTHIVPKWGALALADVGHADVQKWVNDLDLSPASVRKVHRVLSLILAMGVADDRIVRNVAAGVKLPRVVEGERRFLTHEQVDRLADAVGPDWSLIVRFLAYTGLRWGEMAALKVTSVNLLRRRVIVAESVTPVKGVMTWGPTKGHERREVPIPRFLATELERHIFNKGPDELLFVGPRGAVVRSQTFQRAALTAAAAELKIPGFHPHELRHTAASLAIASGADVKVVQQMLGHKSATLTLDLYGHLFGDRLDVVADAMDVARTSALAERVKAV